MKINTCFFPADFRFSTCFSLFIYFFFSLQLVSCDFFVTSDRDIEVEQGAINTGGQHTEK